MSSHKERRLLEDALEAVVNTNKGTGGLSGVTLVKGVSNADKATPRLEIVCESSEIEVIGATITGNTIMTARLTMCSNANDTARATHSTNIGTVEDIIFDTSLMTWLAASGVTGFNVRQIFPRSGRDYVEGETVVSEIVVEAYCDVL